MRSYIYTILTLLFFNSANSQDSLLIRFDDTYHTSSDGRHGFMKLLKCPSDGSFYYAGNPHKFIFPEDFAAEDSAIAFNYFTGWENAPLHKATLLLFEDYSSNKPKIYVDYNHNLDFTDDGSPVTFNQDSTAIVYLKNSKFPDCLFPIKFIYPNLDSESKKQVESILSQSGNDVIGNTLLSVDHWLGDIRMNYKLSEIQLDGKTIKIGLVDFNCNGLYSDEGEDRIIILENDESFVSGSLSEGAIIYSRGEQLKINDQVYEIDSISHSGKLLVLVSSNGKFIPRIQVGSNISDIEITLISGESIAIKELLKDNKYLLLDFWGTWCAGCTQQLPALKELIDSEKDNLDIIGLNFKDSPKNIKKYAKKNKMKWKQGFANEDIIEKLRVDEFPTYLLVDQNGKIISMNADIDEIKNIVR